MPGEVGLQGFGSRVDAVGENAPRGACTYVRSVPIGPQRGDTEQLGLLDGVASADEIALIVLVVLRLSARPLHGGRTIAWLLRGAVGALVLLSSMVLAGGVHAH